MIETDVYSAVDRWIEEHLEQSLEDLVRLCRQPSVSAQGVGMRECAELTATILGEHGFDARLVPSSENPVVLAQAAGEGARTLLFYNHYDVQPPEPLDLWTSPPFEPARRDSKLFARGVSDDKGHIVCRLMALDAWKAVHGPLPCNVKFVIEGNEESGSTGLESFVAQHRSELAADACVWEFGGVNHLGEPEVALGMRGMCYVELAVKTASLDAHSGLGGGIFPNAAWRLVWALASLKGRDERIRIPGFYDDVRPPSADDLRLLGEMAPIDDSLRATYGVKEFLGGVSRVELLRQQVFQPTCTINGLTAGYQGPGTKTVLPCEASAKIDMRMVPDQDPHRIFDALRAYLDAQGFGDVETRLLCAERPARVDPGHPFVRLVIDAARAVYGKRPQVQPIVGGTGPLHPFVTLLKLPVVTAGIGYPGGRAHAPDENIRLEDLVLGARHTARILGGMMSW